MKNEFISALKLSTQRALLGAVTPGLRSVSLKVDGPNITLLGVYESLEAKEAEWEELSVATTEIQADYEAPTVVELKCVVATSESLTNDYEIVVFKRCDAI